MPGPDTCDRSGKPLVEQLRNDFPRAQDAQVVVIAVESAARCFNGAVRPAHQLRSADPARAMPGGIQVFAMRANSHSTRGKKM